MRFLIDMNLSPKWADFLQDSGFGAMHWTAVGVATASDPEIMSFALANGFIVLTCDLDFGAILAATGGNAPSVVQLRTEDCRIEAIGPLVLDALEQARSWLLEGALVTVETERMRVTSLPINQR